MTVRVITEPSVEPISLQEAKDHLRETGSDQDSVLLALIVAARQYAENYLRRSLVQQTLELTLDRFPGRTIELPNPPVQSVTHVKYIDSTGTLQTMDSTLYTLDSYRAPARLEPVWGQIWPYTRSDLNAVQIRYVAGYAPTSSPTDYRENVPAAVKAWMKARVAQLYEHREGIVVGGGGIAEIPRAYIDGLLDPYVVSIFK